MPQNKTECLPACLHMDGWIDVDRQVIDQNAAFDMEDRSSNPGR